MALVAYREYAAHLEMTPTELAILQARVAATFVGTPGSRYASASRVARAQLGDLAQTQRRLERRRSDSQRSASSDLQRFRDLGDYLQGISRDEGVLARIADSLREDVVLLLDWVAPEEPRELLAELRVALERETLATVSDIYDLQLALLDLAEALDYLHLVPITPTWGRRTLSGVTPDWRRAGT